MSEQRGGPDFGEAPITVLLNNVLSGVTGLSSELKGMKSSVEALSSQLAALDARIEGIVGQFRVRNAEVDANIAKIEAQMEHIRLEVRRDVTSLADEFRAERAIFAEKHTEVLEIADEFRTYATFAKWAIGIIGGAQAAGIFTLIAFLIERWML